MVDEPTAPALSYSNGKEYLRSPAHYKRAVERRVDRHDFDFGNAVHARVLGVGTEIVAVPDELLASNGALSTKAAKEFVEEARQQGKVALKSGIVTAVERCAAAVSEHAEAARWLRIPGESEIPLTALDPEFGVVLRGRIDRLPHPVEGARTFPIDLKTTNNATERNVRRVVADLHYDLQAAIYRRLIELTRGDTTGPMVQIYVETEAPYAVNVFELSHEDVIEAGRRKFEFIMREHRACIEADEWPATSAEYPEGMRVLTPAIWYLDSTLDLLEAS